MKRRIFYNGIILTMNKAEPTAEYVLTEGDKVAAVGSAAELEKHIAEGAEPVNLQGRLMLPGFIDSHIHMLTAALNRLKLDISAMEFDTVDDMLAYVRQKKEGSQDPWISVFGFSEENIRASRMVTRKDIDRFFPDVPVTIIRVCGHMSVINTKAMEQLDRDKMECISGGAFEKDENGVYTGIATEGAQQYVLDSMPPADEEVVLALLAQEQEILLRNGITAIHDAGTDMMPPRDYVALYEKMNDRGLLKIRTNLMVRPEEKESPSSFADYLHCCKERHREDARFTIGAVKLFADGSLGGMTAAVNRSYVGAPENTGLLLKERLDTYIKPLADAGHQVAVHAIGDRSTGYVTGLYSACERREEDRLRIEHAELMDEGLIEMIRDNRILIMTQPIFIREFGNTYFSNLGEERAMHIQPIRTLLDQGITVGFGTDYPVDDPNPLLGIRTAMTREIKNSCKRLNEAEGIGFDEAVRCYTINNAYGAFEEAHMGSIEPSKYADFVVLAGIVPDSDGKFRHLDDAAVDMTVIGGETVFSR